MTLPFRRRHHDDEASHDRARSLFSTGMLEALDSKDESWLAGHLAGCAECRSDRERYLADRELLRSLRSSMPQPPRDLWARTAAAIEREAGRPGRRLMPAPPARRRSALAGLPLGAASGLLVVVVVVGAALVSRNAPIVPPPATDTPSGDVAVRTFVPGPTPLTVAAAEVRWLRPGADGNYEFIVADIDEVCPNQRPGCPNLEQRATTPLKLGGQPVGVTLSPIQDELVVISADDVKGPSKIFVVPVPEPEPTRSPSATEPPSTPIATTPVTPTPDATEPGPEPTSEGTIEIARDVVVIGDPTYSADGQWLAFSARPSDLSTGPDLYLWRGGWDAAVAVTSDHRTYFSSWLGNQILASRVELEGAEPTASEAPGGSASPDGSAAPDGTPEPVGEPATPEASVDPAEVPGGASGVTSGRPVSFLLEPETLVMTDLAEPDVWLPVVDPTGNVVVYWSGTVVPTEDGLDWLPAEGRVVLARWAGVDAGAEETAAPSGESSVQPTDGEATSEPGPSVGPAGEPTILAEGPIAAFDARFDPDGARLGLWILERADADIGRLELVVVDPDAGTVDTGVEPLPGVPALRGFSIREGRLAWVTPPGQDGHESAVQVLAWKDRHFGHVQTIPARELLVLR